MLRTEALDVPDIYCTLTAEYNRQETYGATLSVMHSAWKLESGQESELAFIFANATNTPVTFGYDFKAGTDWQDTPQPGQSLKVYQNGLYVQKVIMPEEDSLTVTIPALSVIMVEKTSQPIVEEPAPIDGQPLPVSSETVPTDDEPAESATYPIYTDQVNRIIRMGSGPGGGISEVTGQWALEGAWSLRFDYEFSADINIIGYDLSLDRWGNEPPIDMSLWQTLCVGIKRPEDGTHRVSLRLEDQAWNVCDKIPLLPPARGPDNPLHKIDLASLSNIDLSRIGLIQVLVEGSQPGSGAFYLDNIYLEDPD
jgi:hypothetical protein